MDALGLSAAVLSMGGAAPNAVYAFDTQNNQTQTLSTSSFKYGIVCLTYSYGTSGTMIPMNPVFIIGPQTTSFTIGTYVNGQTPAFGSIGSISCTSTTIKITVSKNAAMSGTVAVFL